MLKSKKHETPNWKKVVNKRPTKCNLCGGAVKYVSNAEIYGRQYGSGYAYLCSVCGAYTGTHKPRPKDALGLLANAEMRRLKVECHDLFDAHWTNYEERCEMYRWLAKQMGISVRDCHFGHFDTEHLKKAKRILESVVI